MADLPSHLHLVYHALQPYPADVPLEDVYAGLDLPIGDGIRPFVYVNMVQTFDGQTVLAGAAWTIGTDVDHHLFRQLRVHADAVLYGAGTLRTDDVVVTTHPPLQERRVRNGQPPNPLGIVVTATCSFPTETFNKKFFRRTDLERLIITTPHAAPADIERVRAAGVAVELVPATPDGEVDLMAVIRYLTGKRVGRVLCEGGPHSTSVLPGPGSSMSCSSPPPCGWAAIPPRPGCSPRPSPTAPSSSLASTIIAPPRGSERCISASVIRAEGATPCWNCRRILGASSTYGHWGPRPVCC